MQNKKLSTQVKLKQYVNVLCILCGVGKELVSQFLLVSSFCQVKTLSHAALKGDQSHNFFIHSEETEFSQGQTTLRVELSLFAYYMLITRAYECILLCMYNNVCNAECGLQLRSE